MQPPFGAVYLTLTSAAFHFAAMTYTPVGAFAGKSLANTFCVSVTPKVSHLLAWICACAAEKAENSRS